MIVDAHAHLWRLAETPQPWIDPAAGMAAIDTDFWFDDLRVLQRAARIDRTVLVQTANSTAETLSFLELAARHPDAVAGVVGWVDLAGDVDAGLAGLAAASGGERLVGIRHLVHQDPDPAWLERAEVGHGLDRLAAAGLPYDLVLRPDQLELATRVVARHPETRFVLDHLGKPPIAGGPSVELARWHRGIAALAAHPNVVAKLSGLGTEADWNGWTDADLRPVVERALEVFGHERLLFGTDWPVSLLAGGPIRWMESARALLEVIGLDEAALAGVFGENATTVYRLSD